MLLSGHLQVSGFTADWGMIFNDIFSLIKSCIHSVDALVLIAPILLYHHKVTEVLLEHGSSGSDGTAETPQYSDVKVRVLLTRRYGYSILTIYLPTLVLLVVSYVTLYIRPTLFDTRMMAALTVQLVIATLFSQVRLVASQDDVRSNDSSLFRETYPVLHEYVLLT